MLWAQAQQQLAAQSAFSTAALVSLACSSKELRHDRTPAWRPALASFEYSLKQTVPEQHLSAPVLAALLSAVFTLIQMFTAVISRRRYF